MKKKYLAIALALVLLFSALTVSANAWDQSEDDGAPVSAGTLKVTVNGKNAAEVKVGDLFVVTVGLYAGDEKILNGQALVNFETKYMSFVPVEGYSAAQKDRLEEGYCFPKSINSSSPVLNYSKPGVINYNFSKAKGADVFNDPSKLFARFCFKATAAGTTDITHDIQYMINASETRIYYKSQPNTEINPYTQISVGKYIPNGDVNADGKVNGGDSGILSRYYAGWAGYDSRIKSMEAADINRDGKVNGADVGILARKVSGWTDYEIYFDKLPA